MDNNAPGSGGKGGLGSLFGGSEYSNTELAGVPLTGMSPLSPYLNVDPRYLVQDTDEFILPTGASKTRGRFELAFFTIGGSCITGAAFGTVNGLRMGLKETREMGWTKPRNVQILNMVTRQGASWANTLGSVGGLKGVARGGLVGLAMSGAYALYSNWDHIRGGSSSSNLY
ncbi:mitochondrial import inner membrane translocase subunit Tim23-like isoform 2-T2 [Salvelinus alpinus]|uniref:mitochondrial import inner membrane translocase subunit Tim23 isoform X2 n=1 Tax=Salvelinus sp. IW2-2015 TaxID=2691554 RepID=UPI000CDFB02C|nr:mitochondrial import inner membrane translocase subunit Tim23 isoform X2 [Salvelinus alpinus]